MKILGLTINLAKKTQKTASNAEPQKKRATTVIRNQPKRNVSFQINDIKVAELLALQPIIPDRFRLHEIYRYILKDARLKSLIRDAKIDVCSEPWMIYMNDTPDEEATKNLNKRWMTHLIEYIVESEFHGYSVVEMDWTADGNATVVLIERQYVSIEKQWILLDGQVNGSRLPYADIMFDIDLLEFGKRNDLGSLLEAAYNIIWKYYSRSDWSRASEKFGMPILSIEANTNDDKELDDLESRAANFGMDGYIVTQAGDKAAIIERAGQRVHDIYLDNIKLCNEEVTLLVNGQTATTDQKSFVGAAEVQERKMDRITTARLQMVVDEFNEKAVPYLIYKGILSEGHRFDYPELMRNKQQRLSGNTLASDPQPQPADKKEMPQKKTTGKLQRNADALISLIHQTKQQ